MSIIERGSNTAESFDLGSLSDGELLDFPSQSFNRRILVIWLYLKGRSQMGLEQFDALLTTLAEKELHKRSASKNPESENGK
jgi:hypothetical protein